MKILGQGFDLTKAIYFINIFQIQYVQDGREQKGLYMDDC